MGTFGRLIPREQHITEVFGRIIQRRLPLTEDAVFLLMYQILKRNGGTILKRVRSSKNVGGYRYFTFSPDIDMLEIRKNSTIVGYELKGTRKSEGVSTPPAYYEGVDEALAYLVNPIANPVSKSNFAGSIFDYVYLVHPIQNIPHSGLEPLVNLLNQCTPIGMITVDYSGSKEVVKPKQNPFVSEEMKHLFLQNLHHFSSALEYTLSLEQK